MAKWNLKRLLFVYIGVSLTAVLWVSIWHTVSNDALVVPTAHRKFSKKGETRSVGFSPETHYSKLLGKDAPTLTKGLGNGARQTINQKFTMGIMKPRRNVSSGSNSLAEGSITMHKTKEYSGFNLDHTLRQNSLPLNQKRLSYWKTKRKHPRSNEWQSNVVIKENDHHYYAVSKARNRRNSSKTGHIVDTILQWHSNRSFEKMSDIDKASVRKSGQESLNSLRKRFPRMMIVGFGKTGTRSLYEALKTRTDIVGLSSERRFFTKEYSKGIYQYLSAFPIPPVQGGWVVEQSPDYIFNILVPRRIKSFAKILNISLEEMTFVVVLHDPIDRAMSEYLEWAEKHRQKHAEELKPFNVMALTRSGKVSENQSFIKKSYYTTYLTRWLRMFNTSRTCFVDGERLASNPYSELKLLEVCLRLDFHFKESNFLYSEKDGLYCLKYVNKVCMNGLNKGRLPQIPLQVKTKLINYYRPMLDELFRVIRRRLSWRNFEAET